MIPKSRNYKMIWSIRIQPKSSALINSTVTSLIVVIPVQEILDMIARQNLKEESARDRVDGRQHLRKITEGSLDHLIENSKVE